jgi:hypothetical protein
MAQLFSTIAFRSSSNLIHDFNFKFDFVEGFCDGFQLADRVVDEASAFASVMKMKSDLSLVVAEVGWSA